MRDSPAQDGLSGVHIGKFRTDDCSARIGQEEDARIVQTSGSRRVPRKLPLGAGILLACTAVVLLAGMSFGERESIVTLSGQFLHLPQPEVQRGQAPLLTVAATISAEPSSLTRLQEWIGLSDEVPPKSFLHLSGLPPVILSVGRAIGPGEWVVPLSGLPSLTMTMPADVSGKFDVAISLLGAWDGPRPLSAQARTTLVITSPRPIAAPIEVGSRVLATTPDRNNAEAASKPTAVETRTALEIAPDSVRATEGPGVVAIPPPPATITHPDPSSQKIALQIPKLTLAERDHAEKLVARGERDLENGNVAIARQFFLRAAEAGLARAALLLAATYDPRELSSPRFLGVQPNLGVAREWYERARALGAPEAEERLARLAGD